MRITSSCKVPKSEVLAALLLCGDLTQRKFQKDQTICTCRSYQAYIIRYCFCSDCAKYQSGDTHVDVEVTAGECLTHLGCVGCCSVFIKNLVALFWFWNTNNETLPINHGKQFTTLSSSMTRALLILSLNFHSFNFYFLTGVVYVMLSTFSPLWRCSPAHIYAYN